MTGRVLDIGPKLRERERLVQKLLADLQRFKSIPEHRRDAECADEGEQTCRALLLELGVEA